MFLAHVYLLPFVLSLLSIILLQLNQRMAMRGADVWAVFPVALLGSLSLMSGYRFMAPGVGGVPGFSLGLATAYTVIARIYALVPRKHGLPRIIWRGDTRRIQELQQQALAAKNAAAVCRE
jgi:hypothetical protein